VRFLTMWLWLVVLTMSFFGSSLGTLINTQKIAAFEDNARRHGHAEEIEKLRFFMNLPADMMIPRKSDSIIRHDLTPRDEI